MNTAVLTALPQRPWWPWAMRALAALFVKLEYLRVHDSLTGEYGCGGAGWRSAGGVDRRQAGSRNRQ